MTSEITLYGIPNCDTVKKARTWLQERGVACRFHDFKKNGLERSALKAWMHQVGAEVLLNRKGTSWRALTDLQKASAATPEGALALMLAQPTLIKRPVLQTPHQLTVGFSAERYHALFSGHYE